MRTWGRLVTATALSLTVGCVAPRATHTQPTLPSTFTARPSVALDAAQPVRAEWWRAFGSEELNALETAAAADNFDMKSAQARILQARAQSVVAGAGRFPAIDLQATRYSRKSGPYVGQSSVAFVATYEIDFWGRNAAQAKAAREREQAARYDAQTVAMTLSASIANAYFEVSGLRQRLKLARKLADDARSLLRLVEIQQEVGTGAELQTELQRNAVATFEESAAAIEMQLEQQQHLLAVLVGRPPQGFLAAPLDSPETQLPVIAPDTPASLLYRRPDIAAAEAQLRAAHLDVDAARAALFPNVSLTAALGSTIAPTHSLHAAAAGLVQPIFHAGALRAQVDYDRARASELESTYRATLLAALRDVEDQLTAQSRIEQEDRAAAVAVTSARRAAFLSEAQFKLGVSDYLSVLTAERAQFQAEDLKLQLHVQRQQAAINLCRALGGGFEE